MSRIKLLEAENRKLGTQLKQSQKQEFGLRKEILDTRQQQKEDSSRAELKNENADLRHQLQELRNELQQRHRHEQQQGESTSENNTV